jgi:hypothetical protein
VPIPDGNAYAYSGFVDGILGEAMLRGRWTQDVAHPRNNSFPGPLLRA